jgi:hypothetical protein
VRGDALSAVPMWTSPLANGRSVVQHEKLSVLPRFLDPPYGIECRTGGATNDYTIVYTFNNPSQLSNPSPALGCQRLLKCRLHQAAQLKIISVWIQNAFFCRTSRQLIALTLFAYLAFLRITCSIHAQTTVTEHVVVT